MVIRKQQLGLFSTGDGPLCDLLSDVAGKLACLELVAEEDHVVGFDDRVDIDFGDPGYNDTSPIGFCNVNHIMDLFPVFVENELIISVFPGTNVHHHMGVGIDSGDQVWIYHGIVIYPNLVAFVQFPAEHLVPDI